MQTQNFRNADGDRIKSEQKENADFSDKQAN